MLKHLSTLKRCLLRTHFPLTWGISSACRWLLNSHWLSLIGVNQILLRDSNWKMNRQMKPVLPFYHVELGLIPIFKNMLSNSLNKNNLLNIINVLVLGPLRDFLLVSLESQLLLFQHECCPVYILFDPLIYHISDPQATHRFHLMLQSSRIPHALMNFDHISIYPSI